MKRSEILAIDNVKRIADQLRSERNDALALAQLRREQLEDGKVLLAEAREALISGSAGQSAQTDNLVQRIERYFEGLEAS